ncbi:MAG TPA: carbohydrate kinase family protein [Kineosporiaceae bacterium]|nr:carbohydrate kinase family protein [Kineosporiaceae bacterium]
MRIAVTGSIATDHLMTFQGRFSDSLVVEQLEQVSLSFLVEDLQIRRGGVAANIAFGLANLGLDPLLVGSVGEDFVDYRSWLTRHGVDCGGVRVSQLQHTARFICTTDSEQAQIASFYAGAMSEAREIELGPLCGQRALDLVVISPNDPEAMLRHTEECRTRGLPFAADPSQQLAWSDGPTIRQLVDGAAYLFSNDYESALIHQKTGWSEADVLARVGVRVTTHGKNGVLIQARGEQDLRVPVVPAQRVADPTGVGDGFRAGFLAALAWGLPLEQCAQVGCLLATLVLETVGTQEYSLGHTDFLVRLGKAYGDAAAAAVEPHLKTLRP